MDLLLQAAKVLELENSAGGSDRAVARSTRGTPFHHYAKLKSSDNPEDSDTSTNYGETQAAAADGDDDDADMPALERRRAGGAGTREVHNQLEKNRRKQLRECFNHLQQCVPTLENKRVPTQSILQGAIKHIKMLKKKDVEQEREIQMLAKKKCELKKKYDVEFNKCSEDQHRVAEALMKARPEASQIRMEEDDGHTSDSTTTASEGPCNEEDFSDDDGQEGVGMVKTGGLIVKIDGSRKRKTGNRSSHFFGARSNETGSLPRPIGLFSNHGSSALSNETGSLPRPVGLFSNQANSKSTPSLPSSSSVSSSSFALKQMLEQKKKQQISTSSHSTPAALQKSQDMGRPKTSTAKSSMRSPSSLTSSHPMISTRLASSIKATTASPSPAAGLATVPAKPLTGPSATAIAAGKNSEVGSMGGALSASNVPKSPVLSASLPFSSTTRVCAAAAAKGLNKLSMAGVKVTAIKPTSPPITLTAPARSVHPSDLAAVASLGQTNPQKIFANASLYPAVDLSTLPRQVNTVSVLRESEVKGKVESGSSIVPRTSSVSPAAASGFNLSASGTAPTTITSTNISVLTPPAKPGDVTLPVGSRIVPTVIPVSLASLIRSLPLTNGMAPLTMSVPATQTPIGISTVGVTQSTLALPSAISSLIPSKIQPVIGAGNQILLTSPSKSNTTSSTTPIQLPSTPNNRLTTLLNPIPPNGVIKPTAPTFNSPAVTSVAMASTSTQGPLSTGMTLTPNTLKTVTLTPTFLPLTMTGVPLSTNTTSAISATPQLRFFAPLNHNSVVAAPLANGQTPLMPTVVQLSAAGQMAVLQNLIPTQNVQVQNQHLLAPPIVMVTAASSVINTSQPVSTSNIGTTVTSASTSSVS